MGLLYLDSFDAYTVLTDRGWTSGNTCFVTAAAGRRSTASLRSQNQNQSNVKPTTPGSTTAILGVAIKAATLPAFSNNTIQIRQGGNPQVSLGFTTSGYVTVYRGAIGATLLGTAVALPLTAGAFSFIEWKVVVHGSAGSVVVRVDNTVVLSLSGINTANTGTAAWDAFLLGNTGNDNTDFDDLYVFDSTGSALNDFVGDTRVDALYPTAEGATIGWTPLSGSDNALMVDEHPPDGDTTYNAAASSPLTDTLVVENAPLPGAVLHAVQLTLTMKKTDAGLCSVAPVVRHSGTDYAGSDQSPATAYASFSIPYGQNPGTSAAWTESDFNAAEFGYKRTA